jgi:threonine/homoserine/homoserine lactone efflux protein
MTFDSALAFVATLLLWVLIPGPAILMVVGRSLSSGFWSTLNLIGGILLGDIFYMSLVFLGLAALGAVLGEFFVVVRVLAAAYLIYLGISLWLKKPGAPKGPNAVSNDALRSFFTGFGITLGNPKAILFHLGFLPTFFDLPALTAMEAVTILALFVSVLGTALALYAYLAGRAAGFFREPSKLRILNRVSGTMLIGAGAAVLAKRG